MSEPKPRFLAEVLGLKTWDEVEAYLKDYEQKHERMPYGYERCLAFPAELEKWKLGFERFVLVNGS